MALSSHMDNPTHITSHQPSTNITREVIQSIDRISEVNATNVFVDSMNSLYSLKEIFYSSVSQFGQSELCIGLPENDQSMLRAFYTLRLAGYLRVFFDEEDPGDWLDDTETESELWLKHHETNESSLLEIGGLIGEKFILPHHIAHRTSDGVHRLLH